MLLADAPSRFRCLLDILFVAVYLALLELAAMWLLAPLYGYTMADLDLRPDEMTQDLLLPVLAVRSIAAIGLILLILCARHQPMASVGLTTKRLGWNLLIGAVSPLAAYALIVPLMFAMVMLFPTVFDQMQENSSRLQALLPKISLWAFAPVMACVGLWEELVFRGFLMTRMRRVIGGHRDASAAGWVPAVVLSTTCFSLLHLGDQTPAALIPITILSLVFSVLTIWRKSLVPAIVGHAIFNLSQVFWMHVVLQPAQ